MWIEMTKDVNHCFQSDRYYLVIRNNIPRVAFIYFNRIKCEQYFCEASGKQWPVNQSPYTHYQKLELPNGTINGS